MTENFIALEMRISHRTVIDESAYVGAMGSAVAGMSSESPKERMF